MQRIASDLDTDLALYRDRYDFWGKTFDYGMTGLAYASDGAAGGLSQWRLLLAYFQASQVAEVFIDRTTYDELKSAGELNFIPGEALRSKLAGYYTNAINPTLTVRPAYREHVRERVPIDVQLHIWRNCYGSAPSGRQILLNCEPPISEGRAAEIVDAIRADQALMGELTFWVSTLEVGAQIIRSQETLASELRQLVGQAIGPKAKPNDE